MTKKMVQKVSLMLCMCFLFCMFGASSAFASEGDKGDKTGVDISWLEDDNGQLNEVTNKAKGLFGSVYGLVMVIFNAVGVFALIFILLSCLTSLNNQMTRAQLKPALFWWTIAMVLGNSVIQLVRIVTSVKV